MPPTICHPATTQPRADLDLVYKVIHHLCSYNVQALVNDVQIISPTRMKSRRVNGSRRSNASESVPVKADRFG